MNQQFNGGFYPMGMGQVPTQNPMPKTGNWLSAEKYNMLQKGLNQFRLSVTEEEVAKAQCNHYYINGASALIPDADGSGACTCAICGTHFTSKEYTSDQVTEVVQNIQDILNTIKIIYLSMDPSAALEFFQIMAFIDKIPQLYNIAVNDFKKYEGVNPFSNSNSINPFTIFSMMTNPGMGYQPMYQNPGMNYQQPMGYANPMGYPQPGAVPPQGQPMYGQGMAQPGMNPAGAPNYVGFNSVMAGQGMAQPGMNPNAYNPMYGQPAAPQPQANGAYVPQSQGFSMNPTGAATNFNTNMPTATAAKNPVEEVKVDTQFKK